MPSCSIEHYHLHVIPVARRVTMADIGQAKASVPSISEAAQYARILRNYILVKAPGHSFELASRQGLASQHVRRIVAALNGYSEWDWRRVERPSDWAQKRVALKPFVDRLYYELEQYASHNMVAA